MNVIYRDILEIDRGIIVHGVNGQGVMGSGIAKSIRERYPQVYLDYMAAHQNGLKLGQVIATQISYHFYVCSAVTQLFYGRDKDTVYVDYRAVFEAFLRVNALASIRDLPVYFPLIGCGLANGDWEIVKREIERGLSPCVSATLCLMP